MAINPECHCTGTHFCSGVGEGVLEVIAQRAGQTVEATKAQAFTGKGAFSGGEAASTRGWRFPAQVAYNRLLKERVIFLPTGNHVEIVQPTGSATSPVEA